MTLRILRPFIVVGLLACTATSGRAQQVIRPPDAAASLGQGWTWAVREAPRTAGTWVGYSFTRRMHANSHVQYRSDRTGRSLHERVYGTPPPGVDDVTPGQAVEQAARRALNKGQGKAVLVDKEIAVLFRLEGGQVREVEVSEMAQPHDPQLRHLLWLGRSEDRASIAFLQERYAEVDGARLQKQVVTAIGLHDGPAVIPALTRFATGPDGVGVREAAVFWLGQTDAPAALDVLRKVVRDDPTSNVREHAVFSLSQMSLDAATDALIDLARRSADPDVREKALFWLGQQASEKAVGALRDAAFAPGETSVQEQAVFSLSRLPKDRGIPMLLEVARTHANPKVRKSAIFWLGQSGDPRALDFLVSIVKGQ